MEPFLLGEDLTPVQKRLVDRLGEFLKEHSEEVSLKLFLQKSGVKGHPLNPRCCLLANLVKLHFPGLDVVVDTSLGLFSKEKFLARFYLPVGWAAIRNQFDTGKLSRFEFERKEKPSGITLPEAKGKSPPIN